MESKQSFGAFICQRRKELGMTQKEFAQQLYVTDSAISKWERGLSYPDITLVEAICRVLQITEHELITSSSDVRQQELEAEARRFRAIRKALLYSLNICYLLALAACLICNLAIDHTLSWFFIVLFSIGLAFTVTTLPLLAPRKKGLVVFGCFTGTLIALLLTCCLYTQGNWFLVALAPTLFGLCVVFLPMLLWQYAPRSFLRRHAAAISLAVDSVLLPPMLWVIAAYTGGGWFWTVGLPIVAFTLPLPWLFLVAIRYLPLNAFFRSAICCAGCGVYVLLANPMLTAILAHKPFRLFPDPISLLDWNITTISGNVNLIVFLSLLLLTLLFIFFGCLWHVRNAKQPSASGRNGI